MRKALLAILIFLVISLPVYAQNVSSVDLSFDLTTSSVREIITIEFSGPTSGETNYTLGAFARNVVVTNGKTSVPFHLINENGVEILSIQANNTERLIIDYTITEVVFKSDNIYHFFTELSFETQRLSARVKLPVGYGLFDESYKPPGADIVSDGQRVILLWDSLPREVFFSVKFVQLNPQTPLMIIIAVTLVMAIIVLYVYYKKRMKEEFKKGFREDERKVVEYMTMKQTKEYVLQRDIQKMFAFSRAKATRVIHVLEKKGLIRKKRYGRTNKLYWKK